MTNSAIQSFGKYQILERIATGSTAEIYKARLEGIGGFQRTFAIKRILSSLSQNSDYIRMLVDEAKVAGLLSHANIVQILDLGQVDGIWYIAMEYVEGRDLGGVLRRVQRKGLCLPVPHAVYIALELLKGLEYAHQRQVMKGGRAMALNIIHRDVSPQNVLLSFQGEVKLTDFGIARASLKAMETVSGIVKGRFDYMSPEQASGDKTLDQRSDLFSVGVLIYEMLTGHHPFRADSEIETIERIRSGTYVPVSQLNSEVPFTLEQIVDTALRVERDERYASATAFKEALDGFFHDAGFIFTHATLSSYVQGLFPDSSAGRIGADGPSAGDGLDGPTRRLQRNRLDDLRPPSGQGQVSTRDSLASELDTDLGVGLGALDDADQETLIRKMPEGWEDALADKIPPELDEQHTVIRRGEAFDKELGGPVHEPPKVEQRNPPQPRAPKAQERPASKESSPRKARRRPAGMLGWVMAVIALVVGVLLGGALTGVMALVAGFQGSGTDPALASPVVQVVGPPSTEVRIDGVAVKMRSEVAPGVSHRVEITPRGGPSLVETLTLNQGEHRVFIIEVPTPR
ncbi:MAG: protein kinase [Myxococcales bacterium]|nr:protein kinase [Myxococcales bacterium]